MKRPTIHECFAHRWRAEILPSRPMILPSRHFVYPVEAEEVERGALEVLVHPAESSHSGRGGEPFLATCALGYRDAAAPTGIWACPDPEWLCAVSGGYAYLIDTAVPERFTMLRYRPVLEVLCHAPESAAGGPGALERTAPLLLFAGHHSILAWGREGEAWESERLSWEGLTGLRVEGNLLLGNGWDLRTDRDLPFVLELATGQRV